MISGIGSDLLRGLQTASPVLVALAGLLKKFGPSLLALPRQRKRAAQRDYAFISDFLQIAIKDRAPFELEQAFAAWHHRSMRCQEIKALLCFASPSAGFRLYKSAAPFVQLARNGRFVYRAKYANRCRRRLRIGFWMAAYFVLAILAVSPVLLLRPTGPIPSGWWVITFFVLVTFGWFAWMALDYSSDLKRSELFLKEQKRTV